MSAQELFEMLEGQTDREFVVSTLHTAKAIDVWELAKGLGIENLNAYANKDKFPELVELVADNFVVEIDDTPDWMKDDTPDWMKDFGDKIGEIPPAKPVAEPVDDLRKKLEGSVIGVWVNTKYPNFLDRWVGRLPEPYRSKFYAFMLTINPAEFAALGVVVLLGKRLVEKVFLDKDQGVVMSDTNEPIGEVEPSGKKEKAKPVTKTTPKVVKRGM